MNQFRELYFAGRRGAEAGADIESFLNRLDYRRGAVTKNERPPGADVVNIFVAIDIINARTLPAGDKQRRASNSAEGPYGRIDTPRNQRLGAGEELFGLGMGLWFGPGQTHARYSPGINF